MDTLFTLVSIVLLGVGLIAAHFFIERSSGSSHTDNAQPTRRSAQTDRRSGDRRVAAPVSFPLALVGESIEVDRRQAAV